MSNKNEYWFVATAANPEGRETQYSLLKSRLESARLVESSAIFDVPKSIKFGRLDDLMRLSDELIKQDTFIEQACRRLEKLGLEIDPNVEFRILWQRSTLSTDQYLSRFIWDEARYPNSRLLKQNVDLLVSGVAKLDEEIRIKASLFNEMKASSQLSSKQELSSLTTRDLTDAFSPDICSAEDFIDTEHLATVAAIVPKSEISAFPTKYWKWNGKIVPFSLKQYQVTDKDGAGLFTMVIFKSALEAVKEVCKANRVAIREFKFSEGAYRYKIEERTKMATEKQKQESILSRICLAAFSECFVAWIHLKAIRIFVECVLRYGLPPDFNAFVLKIPSKVKESKLRKELEDILSSKKTLGYSYFGTQEGDTTAGDDESDIYPYVYTSIAPFALYSQK